jgi:hypothetical protein
VLCIAWGAVWSAYRFNDPLVLLCQLVYVKEVPDIGWGLFAAVDIEKGVQLADFGGGVLESIDKHYKRPLEHQQHSLRVAQ